MKLEDLIARHRPSAEHENEEATADALIHLNANGLLQVAVDRQLEHDRTISKLDDEHGTGISKLVAWEVLSEAQRVGVRLSPLRPRTSKRKPNPDARAKA